MSQIAALKAALNKPNLWQRFALRRETRSHIDDPEMEGTLFKPLVDELLEYGKNCTDVQAQDILDRNYEGAAKAVHAALVKKHAVFGGFNASPFIDFLMQLFQTLGPLLIGCL